MGISGDNYEEKDKELIEDILKQAENRLNNPDFLGVILYNCGIPISHDIRSKIIEQSRDKINWTYVERPIVYRDLIDIIKRLQKVDGSLYLITDLFSTEDPLPQTDSLYKINVKEHFQD